jgi:hypothetical protein
MVNDVVISSGRARDGELVRCEGCGSYLPVGGFYAKKVGDRRYLARFCKDCEYKARKAKKECDGGRWKRGNMQVTGVDLYFKGKNGEFYKVRDARVFVDLGMPCGALDGENGKNGENGVDNMSKKSDDSQVVGGEGIR